MTRYAVIEDGGPYSGYQSCDCPCRKWDRELRAIFEPFRDTGLPPMTLAETLKHVYQTRRDIAFSEPYVKKPLESMDEKDVE